MGQKYFTANKIMPPTLDCLREMTIVEVVSKAAQMQKAFKGQVILLYEGEAISLLI